MSAEAILLWSEKFRLKITKIHVGNYSEGGEKSEMMPMMRSKPAEGIFDNHRITLNNFTYLVKNRT